MSLGELRAVLGLTAEVVRSLEAELSHLRGRLVARAPQEAGGRAEALLARIGQLEARLAGVKVGGREGRQPGWLFLSEPACRSCCHSWKFWRA